MIAVFARRLIPIIEVQDIQEVYPQGASSELIRHAVKRGASVALFCSQRTLLQCAPSFIDAWSQDPSMQQVPFFAINVPKAEEQAHLQPAQIEKMSH
jgi:hypothetical protein